MVRLFKADFWRGKFQKLKDFNFKRDWKRFTVKLFKFTATILSFIILAGFLLYFLINIGVFGRSPSKAALKAHQNDVASEVFSADNVLLGRYFIHDRTNVKYEDIAPVVIEALIATEDARFYNHKGVDTRSLFRVIVKSLLLQEESSGGGSTISQQLAKNLYPRKEYLLFSTLINKVQEMVMARRIESIYTKKEVLELYLNTVPLGGNLFGVERASWRFFNKSAKELKLTEAAVLIGMLKATTTYNPRLNPEKSRERRNVVLAQMVKYKFLDEAQFKKLKETPLILDYQFHTHSEGLAPYFRESLRVELAKWCATQKKKNGEPYNLYTDGLKIYTTIDSKMQLLAERAVRLKMSALQDEFDAHWKGKNPWGSNKSVLISAMKNSDRYKKLKNAGKSDDEIEEIFKAPVTMKVYSWKGVKVRQMSPWDSLRYYQKFLNTGLVSIEPKTGYVKAWVGGINHQVYKYDHVKSKRQVGSTFKPIVYATALEKGIEPCTYFENKLISYPEFENWTPRNSNGEYGGKYSFRGALAHSINTISAQIILQAGIENTVEVGHKMGIESKLPKVPSLALGVANISLFEMVKAYTAFINEGYEIEPIYISRIVDSEGNVIRENESGFGKKALSYQTAAMMLNLMQGVVEEGSASRLRTEFGLSMDIAGKTGTTQNQTDGWFIGITPDLVTGIWVGGENPLVRFRNLSLGQGSHMALPIWGEYMATLSRSRSYRSFANSHFPPLPPHLYEKLNCDSKEEEKQEENFLYKLFNDIFSRNNKSDEERKKEQAIKEKERQQRWDAYRKDKERRKKERKERKKKKHFWE
jgi:penicillin-binding protein 1A